MGQKQLAKDKNMEQEIKQGFSKHLVAKFSRWIQEGDPKFIKLWGTYKAHLLEEDKKHIMNELHVQIQKTTKTDSDNKDLMGSK